MAAVVLFVCALSFTASYFERDPTDSSAQSSGEQYSPWWSYSAVWETLGTWAIAIYAIRQFSEGRRSSDQVFALEKKQAELAEKQHALARLQHIAANQPKLVIRSISIDESPERLGIFAEGHLITGDIVVTNTGNTDAMILESGYRFLITSDALPMAPPLDRVDTLLVPNEPLLAHESRSVDVMGEPPGQEANIIGMGRAARWEIYLMGFIRFSDDTGMERYMGFCRLFVRDNGYNQLGGRFVPVDNPDYEYSD